MGEDETLDIPLSGNWDASTLPAPEGREHEPDPGHSDEQLKELLFASYDEGVMWRRVYSPRHDGQGSSYFGGSPSFGHHMPWPRSHDGSASLMFVGQIDLAHVPDFSLRSLLPEAGILFFFFGIAYGESPTPFGKGGVSASACGVAPAGPRSGENAAIERGRTFGRILYRDGEAVPVDQPNAGAELSLVESREVAARIPEPIVEFFRWRHEPLHDGGRRFIRRQLLGPPRTMQTWSKDLAQTHVLLMQFDTDEPIHWMWGDMGVLQYWTTREELKARRFGNVKVTLGG